MADIKIDKIKFDIFLITIKNFIEKIDENMLTDEQKKEKEYILNFIKFEDEKRLLMEQRKLYYKFYIKNKEKDPKTAADAYKIYLETKEKLKELEKGEYNE